MTIDEIARKNESMILQEIARVGLESIASIVGRDVSTVSRWRDENVHRLAAILALCDLKIVPAHHEYANPEMVEFMRKVTVQALSQPHPPIIWDTAG